MKAGSSKTLSNALIELVLRNSILSIKTNLGFVLNEDLFKLFINQMFVRLIRYDTIYFTVVVNNNCYKGFIQFAQ